MPVFLYNQVMARKSKYRQELADKIVELVGQGYCLKDVAYFCGLSDRTILRWRETHLDFNEAFVKATQRSVENIEAIRRLGHRTYKRKTYISPNYGQKPLISPVNRSQGQLSRPKNPTWLGLPIHPRPMSPYTKRIPHYLNPNTMRVEWVERWRGGEFVLGSCRMEVWEEKHEPIIDDRFVGIVV